MNRSSFRSQRKSKGFTLLEIGIVIAIAAGILIYAVSKGGVQLGNSNSQILAEQSVQINQGLRTAYQNRAYGSVTITNFCQSRQLPTGMCNTGNTAIQHAFGGTVTLTPTTVNGVANTGVTVAYSAIPGSACAQWLNKINNDSVSITVGSTPVKSPTLAYDSSFAITQCANDTNSVSVVMQ
jgi:type II secretory pathway pseudopilin PulG